MANITMYKQQPDFHQRVNETLTRLFEDARSIMLSIIAQAVVSQSSGETKMTFSFPGELFQFQIKDVIAQWEAIGVHASVHHTQIDMLTHCQVTLTFKN